MHHTDTPVLKENSSPDLLAVEQSVLTTPTLKEDLKRASNARFLFDLVICAGMFKVVIHQNLQENQGAILSITYKNMNYRTRSSK